MARHRGRMRRPREVAKSRGRQGTLRELVTNESGMALVAAVLVVMALLSLSLVSAQLASSSVSQSAYERQRLQAAAAAQAGIEAYLAKLNTATGTALCNPLDGSAGAGSYSVAVTLVDEDGAGLPCAGETAAAAGVVLASKGKAGASGRVERTLEAYVQLDPVYGGVDRAIFSDQLLTLSNRLTVNQYQSNDGDLYTNGNFTSTNNTMIQGTVYAQGTASVSNSGTIAGSLWANGAVALSNSATVDGNVTSSTSSVVLQNSAHVSGDASAGTLVSAAPGAIEGQITQNAPQGPPPQEELPRMMWDPAAWQVAGYMVRSFADCGSAKTFIESIAGGDYAVRITGNCSLSWSNNSTINVRGNLAIVTDGGISTTNRVTFNGIGGPWNLFLMVPYASTGTPVCNGPGTMSFSNLTSLNGVRTLVYTPCSLSFGNNNTNGWEGQLIGGVVTITNHMTLNYHPMTVPGSVVTGFEGGVGYLREVA